MSDTNTTALIHINFNYELAYAYLSRTREELVVLSFVFFFWALFATLLLCWGCLKLRHANTPRTSSTALTPAQVKSARPLLVANNNARRSASTGR